MEVVTVTANNTYNNGTDFKTLASSYIMHTIGKIVLLYSVVIISKQLLVFSSGMLSTLTVEQDVFKIKILNLVFIKGVIRSYRFCTWMLICRQRGGQQIKLGKKSWCNM